MITGTEGIFLISHPQPEQLGFSYLISQTITGLEEGFLPGKILNCLRLIFKNIVSTFRQIKIIRPTIA